MLRKILEDHYEAVLRNPKELFKLPAWYSNLITEVRLKLIEEDQREVSEAASKIHAAYAATLSTARKGIGFLYGDIKYACKNSFEGYRDSLEKKSYEYFDPEKRTGEFFMKTSKIENSRELLAEVKKMVDDELLKNTFSSILGEAV